MCPSAKAKKTKAEKKATLDKALRHQENLRRLVRKGVAFICKRSPAGEVRRRPQNNAKRKSKSAPSEAKKQATRQLAVKMTVARLANEEAEKNVRSQRRSKLRSQGKQPLEVNESN